MKRRKNNYIFVLGFFVVIMISMYTKSMPIAGNISDKEIDRFSIVNNGQAVGEKLDKSNDKSSDKSSDRSNSIEVSREILIVNKDNPLPEGYRPSDLRNVDIPFNHPEGSEMNMMREDAAKHLEEMVAAAKSDEVYLIGVSGFRSYDYQKELYYNEIRQNGEENANSLVAKPGYSEHNTGLAIDLFSRDYPYLDEGFEGSSAFLWLSNNADDYGFILRYPKAKEAVTGYSYEPWHYRYVGVDVARDIADRGITLEEYIRSIN